jgi:hypothetical protein
MTMEDIGMRGYLGNQAGGIYGSGVQEELARQQRDAYYRQILAQQNANPFNSIQQMAQPQPTKPKDDPLLVLLTEE